MELSEKDKQYLHAINELGGEASTREIRTRTDLGTRQVNYRHRKFRNNGFVNIEKDSSRTADYVSPMKVASLTKKGQRVVADEDMTDIETEESIEERLSELESEFNAYRRNAHPWMEEVESRLERLEKHLQEEDSR